MMKTRRRLVLISSLSLLLPAAPSCEQREDLASTEKAHEAAEASTPAEDDLPAHLAEPLFLGGPLSDLCGEDLFTDESRYVTLGVDDQGNTYYRIHGALREKPSITFDFLGGSQDAEALTAEARFVSSVLAGDILDTAKNLGGSFLDGIGDSVGEIWNSLATFATSAWKLAVDKKFRNQFIADVGRWTAEIGYDLRQLTWSQLVAAGGKLYDWVRNTPWKDTRDFITGVAVAYWENAREAEAQDQGFSTESIRLGESTWKALGDRTHFRVGGSVVPEVALITAAILLAPKNGGASITATASISAGRAIGKVGTETLGKGTLDARRAAPVEELKQMERIFPQAGSLMARARAVSQRSEAALAIRTEAVRKLSPLLDPRKLATLKGDRAMNSRLKKIMYYLWDCENAGLSPKASLDEVYRGYRDIEIPEGVIRAEPFDKQSVLENYRSAQEWGLFDTQENLEALRHGRSPSIRKGDHAGELVEVDHRIPVKHAPELSNSPGNLILTPKSVNRERGASLDPRARNAAEDFQRETDWRPSPELAKELSADP